MSPTERKYRNFKKQISAKKHTVGTLTIFVLILVVAFTTMFVVFNDSTATADIEDLLTWSVAGINVSGTWYINSTHVNWTDVQNINECYIYKDMGAENIGDFNYSFDFHIESAQNGASPGGLAVSPEYIARGAATGHDNIAVYYNVNVAGTTKKIMLHEFRTEVSDTLDNNIEPPFTKYMVFTRVGSTATLMIYNDSAHAVHFDTLTIACNPNASRYMYVFQPFDHASDVNVNTGYHANLDLEYGASNASNFTLKGVSTPYNITFSGSVGATVYCNSSGDANEWPEINMTINATDNMTELRVWIGDLNDTGAYINASNMTLYISSDNATYGYLGTFPDGGGNCTNHINTTNWVDVTMGTNPFNGTGLHDKTDSIYFIIKLTIPGDLGTDIFYSATITDWKVYIGHFSA